MNEYLVTWEIEVTAENPVEAAREALRIQRDPESTATVFTVDDQRLPFPEKIDLSDSGAMATYKEDQRILRKWDG